MVEIANGGISRRDFLKRALGFGAGVAATYLNSASTSPIIRNPEKKVPLNSNEIVKAVIGIDPANYRYGDQQYKAEIALRDQSRLKDLDSLKEMAWIVHFGQTHGTMSMVANIIAGLSDVAVPSQEAIASMLVDANIKTLYNEGIDPELASFLSNARIFREKCAALPPNVDSSFSSANNYWDDYNRTTEVRFPSEDTFNRQEAEQVGNYVFLESTRLLNGGLLPDDAEITADSKGWSVGVAVALSQLDHPLLQIGAGTALYVDGKIDEIRATEDNGILEKIDEKRRIIDEKNSMMKKNGITDAEKKLLSDQIIQLNAESDELILHDREMHALSAILNSGTLQSGKPVALIFGTGHDFQREFLSLVDDANIGLIVIKPEDEHDKYRDK